mmetsp:Transcript_14395/g.39633  ORF Transcript_14395/g.39633 Transcript_14395/m.39633 type:complete len:202 (+) Transcript_14395:483-1088(+)
MEIVRIALSRHWIPLMVEVAVEKRADVMLLPSDSSKLMVNRSRTRNSSSRKRLTGLRTSSRGGWAFAAVMERGALVNVASSEIGLRTMYVNSNTSLMNDDMSPATNPRSCREPKVSRRRRPSCARHRVENCLKRWILVPPSWSKISISISSTPSGMLISKISPSMTVPEKYRVSPLPASMYASSGLGITSLSHCNPVIVLF